MMNNTKNEKKSSSSSSSSSAAAAAARSRNYISESEPTNIDVLCGRGNVFASHPGNVAFQKLICDNIDRYTAAKGGRPEKVKVVDDVMRQVKESGARIVKHDAQTDRWYEISRAEAHQKCGHCLRDTIRSRKNTAAAAAAAAAAAVATAEVNSSNQRRDTTTIAIDKSYNTSPTGGAKNSNGNNRKSKNKNNKSSDAIREQIRQKRLALHKSMKSIDAFVTKMASCGGGGGGTATADPYYKKMFTNFGGGGGGGGNNTFMTTNNNNYYNNNNNRFGGAISGVVGDGGGGNCNPVSSSSIIIDDVLMNPRITDVEDAVALMDTTTANTTEKPNNGCLSSFTKDTSFIREPQQRRHSSIILFDDEFPESNMSFSPSTFFNSLRIQ